jgi:multiple sugar transport system permease protein
MKLLLAPFLAGALLLVAVPAAATFAVAFTDWNLLEPASFVGTDNFAELADDPILHRALLNSLIFLAIAVPLRLAVAVGAALLLHRQARARSAERAGVYLPTVVPDVAFALLFLFLLNPLYGPVNAAITGLGFPAVEWFTSAGGAMAAIVIISVFTIGEGFVVALAARQELPGELDDLARLEGAGARFRLRRVTLPLMRPTLLLLAGRDLAYALQLTFVPALLVTGTGPDRATLFVPGYVFETAFEDLRYGYAASVTLVLYLITLLVIAAEVRLLRRRRFGLGG